MIKALLLIFEPVQAWESVRRDQRPLSSILLVYLLPMLVIAGAVEGFRLTQYPRQGAIKELSPYSISEAGIYELGQLALSVVVVFIGAHLIKSIGETFHGRHTLAQGFRTVAYGLSPLFLLRLLDGFSGVSPWVSWSIGILLSAAVLYHGVWRMMEPDPPHAFGLYVVSVLLLALTTALARYVTWLYLRGDFTGLEKTVSSISRQLHL